jgi:hypothetical protein
MGIFDDEAVYDVDEEDHEREESGINHLLPIKLSFNIG